MLRVHKTNISTSGLYDYVAMLLLHWVTVSYPSSNNSPGESGICIDDMELTASVIAAI